MRKWPTGNITNHDASVTPMVGSGNTVSPLDHREGFHPVLGSVRARPSRADFMRRAMRRRFAVPLKHQHPRGVMVAKPGPQAQHVICQMWQPSPKTTGQHLSYLVRAGSGGGGTRAELFTEAGQTVDRRAFVNAAAHDPGQYRLIISPQAGHQVDLQRLTRTLMMHVQTQALKAPVAWVGAIHRDTLHPHAHVVMRGVDARGREVHFTHDYRTRSFQYQAQHLVTQWLGLVVFPASDLHAFEAWVTTHMQEAQRMHDDHPAHEVPMLPDPPLRPRILTTEEAQRRIEETRQRMSQMMARLRARHAPARQIEPEALQHQPGEPEHSQSPDQQATPAQDRGMEI